MKEGIKNKKNNYINWRQWMWKNSFNEIIIEFM